MFTPINKETSKKKLKSIYKERLELKYKYYSFLTDFDIDSVFNIQIKHVENIELFTQIKEYCLYNSLQVMDLDIDKYNIVEYKRVLFVYIEKCIDNKEYIKAKKLLNFCKQREYYENDYYKLLDKLYVSYGIKK
ncbi:hypothetical protein NAPIS_ORF00878 [Vairimorpha apis BRL 01]|uniref:Uncharacterized protein n=1 Tax=Vairimorpha apis BRL 01 TaxID=1037528 RepID=T0MEM8_9MICR|nr:hypothetical protein NAPIS_ORF00878 [Vairimorpha apis BRL 01]